MHGLFKFCTEKLIENFLDTESYISLDTWYRTISVKTSTLSAEPVARMNSL